MRVTPDQKADSPELLDLFLPLHFFYSSSGKVLPEVGVAEGGDLPEPYRHLLVHQADMTSRLRNHHGSELELEVLSRQQSPDYLIRMVVLKTVTESRPVEFGAIGIHLEQFPKEARERVVAGDTPLGAILEKYEVAYRSKPRAYFGVFADELISQALQSELGSLLYGRCNVLSTPDGITMADIVEVLPEEKP